LPLPSKHSVTTLVRTDFTPTVEQSNLSKVWPVLEDKVGFYIGDNESMGSQKSTPKKNVFYLGEETSLTSRQKSENGSQNSFASSILDQQQQDTDSAKSQINQDSNWRYLLSDDEPVLSPSASKEGAKNLSNFILQDWPNFTQIRLFHCRSKISWKGTQVISLLQWLTINWGGTVIMFKRYWRRSGQNNGREKKMRSPMSTLIQGWIILCLSLLMTCLIRYTSQNLKT
jgi:hypothetical protein